MCLGYKKTPDFMVSSYPVLPVSTPKMKKTDFSTAMSPPLALKQLSILPLDSGGQSKWP